MTKKLNVCFVTEDFYPSFIGGQGIYGKELVEHLAKDGIHVTALADRRPGRRDYWRNHANITLIEMPFSGSSQLLAAFFEYCYFMFYCRKIYFDILHANQLSGLFFVLLRPKNIGAIIVSAHHTNYDMRRETPVGIKKFLYLPLIALERFVYEHADGIITNSPDEAAALRSNFHLNHIPITSVYPGLSLKPAQAREQVLARASLRQMLDVPLDAKVILYVGRLVARKKVDTFIDAVNNVSHKGAPVIGVIVGRGREKEQLKKLAGPSVYFCDYVADTRLYFLGADIFVTTSVAEGGFSYAVLEAAHFGLPLIVSQSVAGFPIVRPGVNGFVVHSNNHYEIARAIEKILPSAAAMGRTSRKLARKFTSRRATLQTIAFYRSALRKASM